MRFQNGQVFDLAILNPGFELARPFQKQRRFQNGQVNILAVGRFETARVSKWPGIVVVVAVVEAAVVVAVVAAVAVVVFM